MKKYIAPYYLLVFILTIFISGCKRPKEENLESNHYTFEKNDSTRIDAPIGITLISSSEEDTPTTVIKRNVTFLERLEGISSVDTIYQGDTVFIPFEDYIELVEFSPADQFSWKEYLLEAGDTVLLSWENEDLKLFNFEKKRLPQWDFFDVFLRNDSSKKADSLKSIFVITRKMGDADFLLPNVSMKDKWEESISDYVFYTKAFYNNLFDSLNQKKDSKNLFYATLVRQKKFNDLEQVFNVIKNKKLLQDLYDEYLTLDNFQNRYLSGVFGRFYFREYARQRNVDLQEVYEGSFQEFDPIIIRYFKSRTIQEMVGKKYNRDVIILFLDRYKEDYGELSPLEELSQEMEYQAIKVDDMILQGMNGETIFWEELKKQWKGKIIYLDFWASWCAPCLRAMPFSHKLKTKFNSEDIVFVYLSINDKEKPWLEKSNQFAINENNFLIINSKTSEFIRTNKVNTIPRYLIFDKEGNLVHLDAPSPDKDEAFIVLSQILGK